MGFIDDIKARAKTSKKTIVLPETEDIRTYEAAEIDQLHAKGFIGVLHMGKNQI